MTHDGSNTTLQDFLSAQVFSAYIATEKADIVAYLVSFDTGTAPTVGYTLTLTAATVAGSSVQSDWATLQSQAGLGNYDLIGRGTIQGQVHGLLYQPSTNNYISDAGGVYSQAQLRHLELHGCVPGDGDDLEPGTLYYSERSYLRFAITPGKLLSSTVMWRTKFLEWSRLA